MGPSLCERQGRVGVNSLPPRRTITKSPCRSYQLFVRSIVISLDTKFANVSTLVTGKSTHMQSQDRHFFLLFHSAYSQCWWQARWSILYLCREEGFFLLPLATLGPHASQDTYYQVAPRTSLPSPLCVCNSCNTDRASSDLQEWGRQQVPST